MKRKAALAAGYLIYLLFLATFAYFVFFSGNLLVAKTIDQGGAIDTPMALAINLMLMLLFGLQHSGMARPKFKQWWSDRFPKALQRSGYVLTASLTLIGFMLAWRPLPQVIWEIKTAWLRTVFWLLFGSGWILVFVSAQLISSRHLFGLQQVTQFSRGQSISSPPFQTPSLYRHVRHPMMLGFLIAFWAAPTMTVGHLIFAAGMTAYILIGLRFEERDLISHLGEIYMRYRQAVPMLVPLPGKSVDPANPQTEFGSRTG